MLIAILILAVVIGAVIIKFCIQIILGVWGFIVANLIPIITIALLIGAWLLFEDALAVAIVGIALGILYFAFFKK